MKRIMSQRVAAERTQLLLRDARETADLFQWRIGRKDIRKEGYKEGRRGEETL